MKNQIHWLFERITYIYDPLNEFYEREQLHKIFSAGLVVFFLASLLIIELNRNHLLPAAIASHIPYSHFHAVQLAFSIILVMEVFSLIFVLPCSFSKSLGKQFEILSLILIRNAFKELSYFPEPITYLENQDKIFHILSDGFGALLIFALLGVYYRLQSRPEETNQGIDLFSFVAAKKGISLLLLIAFFVMGISSIPAGFSHGTGDSDFFHDFYTLLILTDILIVLISQYFHPSSKFVFRNSGFALSTLIIRIALVAPVYYNVLLGGTAICFAILLTLISRYLFTYDSQI